jgi:hypothetical protein
MATAPKVNKRPKTTKAVVPSEKKKERKPRKPPLDRAVKMVVTLERKCSALVKNVGRWHASDDEIGATITKLQAQLPNLKSVMGEIATCVGDLVEAGVKIETSGGGGGGRTPMSPGDHVELRENRYEPSVHGANEFELIAVRGKFYEIRSREIGDVHFVPRQWLRRQAKGAVD